MLESHINSRNHLKFDTSTTFIKFTQSQPSGARKKLWPALMLFAITSSFALPAAAHPHENCHCHQTEVAAHKTGDKQANNKTTETVSDNANYAPAALKGRVPEHAWWAAGKIRPNSLLDHIISAEQNMTDSRYFRYRMIYHDKQAWEVTVFEDIPGNRELKAAKIIEYPIDEG